MKKETSKLKKLWVILKKNRLLIIWVLAGLLFIYTKNKEFTLLNIITSVFISIMLYGIFIWGYKK